METLLTSVLLLATPTDFAQSAPEQRPAPVEAPAGSELESEPEFEQTPLVCPAGQFPSTFSDVYPTDWAYQAVVRLSSRPLECFDLPVNEF